MTARDLRAVAAVNTVARKAAADAAVASDPTGILARFRKFADTAGFSTNVSSHKIAEYHRASTILDTRSVHIALAGGDVTVGLAKFHSGSWAARREAFEDLWDDGHEFVYGALNTDGMGTEDYGPFCLFISNPERHVAAVFPDDTAGRYTDAAASADAVRAAEEATQWEDRAHLVTLERHAEIDHRVGNWPALVCAPGRYFEVVLVPPPPLAEIGEVRMRRTYVTRLDELQARVVSGEVLTDDEANEAAAYDVLHAWRRAGVASLVEVD